MCIRPFKALLYFTALHSMSASAVEAAPASGAAQEIARAGSQPSAAGPAAYFTGRVRIDPVWHEQYTAR